MSPTFRRTALLRAAKLFDLAVVSVIFFAAIAVATGAFTWTSLAHVLALRIALVNVFFFAGFLILSAAIFSICGFYRSHRLSHRSRWLREIFTAVTLISGTIFVLKEPLDLQFASDRFLWLFPLLLLATLVLSREAGQRLAYYARSRGRNLRSIVIVGEGFEANALAEQIEKNDALGYRVLQIIDAKEITEDDRIANRIGA
jgi:FlaA1/EpsC-like NDP-sugar epimerase